MEKKVNFAVVGAFVLVLSAVLVGTVLWLSSGKWSRKTYDTYLVYMSESVSGLDPDAAVRYRGVQVGSVRRIALAQDDVERVLLTLNIVRGTPIKQDTVAVLSTQGLTGIAHIELTGGSRAAQPLTAVEGAEHPVIPSAPSLMVRLDAAVTGLITNVSRSSEQFNALLDSGNRAAIRDLLANLEVVSRTLRTRAPMIDSGVANASKTMENTARLTEALPQIIERVGKSADAIERMAGEVTRAGVSATNTLESVRVDAGRFAGETLPEAQALVVELRELTASLRRVSDDIERQPALLLRGRPASKPGPGE